ncbi:MAG TPA: glycoside hydrolase family 75 protein [Sphingomicrobium sp.]|nr:glycoside hydrolase family 75 protein [Sphingomicrobium sp.]
MEFLGRLLLTQGQTELVTRALRSIAPKLAAAHSPEAMSDFRPWTKYKGIALARHPSGAYTYSTEHVALDADGSPFAYHPDNSGRDDLGYASWPSGSEDWRLILVPDPIDPSRPYVQPSGPAKGYFLSMTSLRSSQGRPTDAGTYVNSESIPYLVFPGDFLRIADVGSFGDLAMARNLANGRTSWAIVADQAPASHPLGEISLRLAENLGGSNPNPRNGDGIAPGVVQYMVFPNSRLDPPWPQNKKSLEATAHRLFLAVGGWPKSR